MTTIVAAVSSIDTVDVCCAEVGLNAISLIVTGLPAGTLCVIGTAYLYALTRFTTTTHTAGVVVRTRIRTLVGKAIAFAQAILVG